MGWIAAGAGIAAVGSIASSAMGASAASGAANAQSQSAQNTLGFQEGVYNNTTANLQPYVNIGTNALYSLASLYGLSTPGSTGGATTTTSNSTASSAPASAGGGLPNGWSFIPGTPAGEGENASGAAPAQIVDAQGNVVQTLGPGATMADALAMYGGGVGNGGGSAAVTSTPVATSSSSPMNNPAMTAFNQFTQLPSYQFPLQQGQLATNRALASSGLLNSGGALKALTQYGQGYASTGFNNYLAQLSALANNGQNAAVQTASAGNQAALTVNNADNTIGTAGASGIVGGANAINSGVNSLTGLLTSPSAYSSLGGTGGGSLLSNLFGSGGGGASYAPAGDFSGIGSTGMLVE